MVPIRTGSSALATPRQASSDSPWLHPAPFDRSSARPRRRGHQAARQHGRQRWARRGERSVGAWGGSRVWCPTVAVRAASVRAQHPLREHARADDLGGLCGDPTSSRFAAGSGPSRVTRRRSTAASELLPRGPSEPHPGPAWRTDLEPHRGPPLLGRLAVAAPGAAPARSHDPACGPPEEHRILEAATSPARTGDGVGVAGRVEASSSRRSPSRRGRSTAGHPQHHATSSSPRPDPERSRDGCR